MQQEHQNTITQNKLKQLKPTFGNRVGLFTKEKIEVDLVRKINKETQSRVRLTVDSFWVAFKHS